MRDFQRQNKQTVLFFSLRSMLLILKMYDFFIKWNKSKIIYGEIPYFALKI